MIGQRLDLVPAVWWRTLWAGQVAMATDNGKATPVPDPSLRFLGVVAETLPWWRFPRHVLVWTEGSTNIPDP